MLPRLLCEQLCSLNPDEVRWCEPACIGNERGKVVCHVYRPAACCGNCMHKTACVNVTLFT